MQASKSRQDLVDFDTFECLSCHAVIREAKPQRLAGDKGEPRAGRGASDQ
jgi:hypothetical protein